MPQTPILTSSLVARTVAASALLAVACFGVARAQTPAPPKEGQAGATRERRAAEAPKDEPAAKAEAGAKDSTWSGSLNVVAGEEAKGAGGEAAQPEAEASAVEESGAPASGEVSLEELRARIEAEKDKAARARMQRELVERLTAAGRTAEAVASLRAMLAEERFDPPFFYNVGNQLARLGESGSAVEAYRKAAGQRRGGYARAQHNLGVVLIRLGRWQEAEEALTTALRLESFNYAEASYNLGRLHALRGEAGLAIREWARTLRLKPDHAPAAAALARALAEDGDPKEALAVLDSFSARLARRGLPAPPEVVSARAE
ncbi:MAG TPA: tetratricopeptide repeat protein, partial [Pyrinomonadaceae bacterium]|nr:tetratricopeptide repeat protein [Pyrinomonadaceae bacterium]